VTTEELAAQEFWDELRKTTQARIGLGRAGNALPTRQVLELAAAHAAARDAVHEPLDVESFITEVRRVGIGEPAVVRSRATSRAEYLRRPDLGRLPEGPMQVPDTPADIGFVLADGLSPYALAKHGAGLLAELVAQLRDRYTLAPPVIATQARVGLGDHIAERAHVRTLLVVIGERPGLSVADSLGIYLTHLPRVGRTDATASQTFIPPKVWAIGRQLASRQVWSPGRTNWGIRVWISRTRRERPRLGRSASSNSTDRIEQINFDGPTAAWSPTAATGRAVHEGVGLQLPDLLM